MAHAPPRRSSGSTSLPSLAKPSSTLGTSSSTPTLPAIQKPAGPSRGIYGRQWASEHKRYLHELRERSWLRQQGKHGMVFFSESERTELRRYFEAIAEVESANTSKQRKIRVDRLEDMLISLGLAENRHEVEAIVRAIDDEESGELDFEQYLTIVRTRADPAIFQVFKAMIDGKLGDGNLDFRTVISGYRRGMIIDATGARTASPSEPELDKKKKSEIEATKRRGNRILHNFATLQNSRYEKAEKSGQKAGGDVLPFDARGRAPPGSMELLWHTVCADHGLLPSPRASGDGTSKRTLDPPMSPREVIERIVQANGKKSINQRRGTLIISAPDSSLKTTSPKSGSRPGTQQGSKEFRTALCS